MTFREISLALLHF